MIRILKFLTLTSMSWFIGFSLFAQTGPIAKNNSKYLGNIYSENQLPNFAQYWNQVTPENAGKWGSVEATRDVMNWTALDAAYKLAKDNNFPFRMHVMVWGNQQPAWIENLPQAEQLEEIKEWFAAVAARYPAIDFIEIVNEPIHDAPNTTGNGGGNYINALGGTGTTQWDWIINAFKLGRQYFPNAKLMINEYNIINSSSKTTTYNQIIQLLINENLLDAVGLQGHAFTTFGTSTATLTNNLNLIAAKGKPIYITELDIDGPTDVAQLNEYKRVFPIFWDNPAVKGITLWGYRPGLWRDAQRAYLITAGETERPALTWLKEYVNTTVTGIKENEIDGLILYPNPVIAKKINIEGLTRNSLIKIYDLLGNLIKEEKVGNPAGLEIQLPVSSGIYFMHLSDGKKQSIRKIIVH